MSVDQASRVSARSSFLRSLRRRRLGRAVDAAAPTRTGAGRPLVEHLEVRAFLSAVTITNFKSPVGGLGLRGIAVDHSGNFWFAEPGSGANPGRIGELVEDNGTGPSGKPNGTFLQFSIPNPGARPQYIAAGPDGNMWFTENPGGKIGKITPQGEVTEYTIPTANAQPQKIIAASDGDLWFTEFSLNATPSLDTSKVAKLTTDGTFTEYSTLFAPPPPDEPLGLVDRGDGNIWYVANNSSRVGYQGISSGSAGETSVPTANSAPFGIAAGSDNALWYTESATDKIGRIRNLFTAQTEYNLPAGTEPENIIAGPDGDLYFTAFGTGKIGQIDPGDVDDGVAPTIKFFTTGITPSALPTDLVVGADDNIWFTENAQDSIGRLNLYADAQDLTAKVKPDLAAGQTFSGTVATFTSDLPDSVPSDFRVNIDWGDGSLPTPGTITKGAGGQFFVSGTHTYADGTAAGSPDTLGVLLTRSNGRYPLTATTDVTVNGPGGTPTPTLPTIAIGDVTQSEGTGGTTAFNFTVTRTGDLTGATSVQYATADGSATVADNDYQSVANTLAFNPGEASKTITVLVNGDAEYEAAETFVVNLSSATGATIGDAQATGTILNDDAQAVLSVADASVVEGNGGTSTLKFTVTRTGNTAVAASVNYGTFDGTATVSGVNADYQDAEGVVDFAPGETSRTVSVVVNGDKLAEADETLGIALSTPSDDAKIAVGLATGTIVNDDHAPVAADDSYTVAQDKALTVAASGVLSNDTDADGDPLTAAIATTPTHGTVALNANGSLVYTPAAGYSGPDSFTYTAGDGSNTSAPATVTLNVTPTPPPPAATLAINNVTMTEGNSGTKSYVFTVTRSGDLGGVSTVHFATADGTAKAGSDYTAASGNLTFAAGQATKTFTVAVKGDTSVEIDESFKVNLSSPTNATIADGQGIGTIKNDDTPPAKPRLSIGGYTAVEGKSGTKAFTFKVTLDKSSSTPVTVKYATADGSAKAASDYKAASGQLTFAAGQTVQTITVYVYGDAAKEADENFFVNLLSPTNADIAVGKGTGLIKNDD